MMFIMMTTTTTLITTVAKMRYNGFFASSCIYVRWICIPLLLLLLSSSWHATAVFAVVFVVVVVYENTKEIQWSQCRPLLYDSFALWLFLGKITCTLLHNYNRTIEMCLCWSVCRRSMCGRVCLLWSIRTDTNASIYISSVFLSVMSYVHCIFHFIFLLWAVVWL